MKSLSESLNRMKTLMNLKENVEEFNPEVLSTLTSFRARVQYCTQHLGKPLGAGSSRIVFDMGDKVLKLAKNKKGLAQNRNEASVAGQDHFSVITQVFAEDEENDWWLVAEKVVPAKPSDFDAIVGYSFQVVQSFLDDVEGSRSNKFYRQHPTLDPELLQYLWDHEFFYGLAQLSSDHDMPVADMQHLSSWGVAVRNGERELVLADYGLTQRTWDAHYLREFED